MLFNEKVIDMKNILSSRGKIPVGGMITIIVIIGAIYGLITYYPLFQTHYRLKEIVFEAGNKAVHEKSESKLKDYILTKAQQKDITIHNKDVSVMRNESENTVQINLYYTIPIVFPLAGYTRNEEHLIEYETDLTPLDWQELKEQTKF